MMIKPVINYYDDDDEDGGATKYLVNAIIEENDNTKGGYTDNATNEIKEINGRIFKSISNPPKFDYLGQYINNIELYADLGDGYKIYKGRVSNGRYQYSYYIPERGRVGTHYKNGTTESKNPAYWAYPRQPESAVQKVNGLANEIEVDGHTFYHPLKCPDVTRSDILIFANLGDGYKVHKGKFNFLGYDGQGVSLTEVNYYVNKMYLGTLTIVNGNGNELKYAQRGETPNVFWWSYPPLEAAPVKDDKKTILELRLQVIHLEEQVAKLRESLTEKIDENKDLESMVIDSSNELSKWRALISQYKQEASQADARHKALNERIKELKQELKALTIGYNKQSYENTMLSNSLLLENNQLRDLIQELAKSEKISTDELIEDARKVFNLEQKPYFHNTHDYLVFRAKERNG